MTSDIFELCGLDIMYEMIIFTLAWSFH